MNESRQRWYRLILNIISGLLAVAGFMLILLDQVQIGFSLIVIALVASIVRHHFPTIMM
ncbi:hypothetical protein [Lacticaseibacillus porcinae]|uniref:hypothetical protein n=1 Tax=Lacticaseibacillus porcinae TaxID=1123687 RepID=UPI0013DDF845|nr:hypothetical protein [Lacticaseibacillus porcinae]